MAGFSNLFGGLSEAHCTWFERGGDQATATVLCKTETLLDSTSGSRSTDFKMALSALTLKTAYTFCPDGLS